MRRGEIWWAALPAPADYDDSEPRRPVLVIQADAFNGSVMQTVVVVVLTADLMLAAAPGNVKLTPRQSGLSRDAVVNVSQVMTLDRELLTECAGRLPPVKLREVEEGLRQVLEL